MNYDPKRYWTPIEEVARHGAKTIPYILIDNEQ